MVKRAAPERDEAVGAEPGRLRWSSRSKPMIAPSTRPTTRRSARSSCVSSDSPGFTRRLGVSMPRSRSARRRTPRRASTSRSPRVEGAAAQDEAEPDRHEAYQQQAGRDVDPRRPPARADGRPQDAQQERAEREVGELRREGTDGVRGVAAAGTCSARRGRTARATTPSRRVDREPRRRRPRTRRRPRRSSRSAAGTARARSDRAQDRSAGRLGGVELARRDGDRRPRRTTTPAIAAGSAAHQVDRAGCGATSPSDARAPDEREEDRVGRRPRGEGEERRAPRPRHR